MNAEVAVQLPLTANAQWVGTNDGYYLEPAAVDNPQLAYIKDELAAARQAATSWFTLPNNNLVEIPLPKLAFPQRPVDTTLAMLSQLTGKQLVIASFGFINDLQPNLQNQLIGNLPVAETTLHKLGRRDPGSATTYVLLKHADTMLRASGGQFFWERKLGSGETVTSRTGITHLEKALKNAMDLGGFYRHSAGILTSTTLARLAMFDYTNSIT